MFVDLPQINSLLSTNTFIDIGLGSDGTPEFYNRFQKAKLFSYLRLEKGGFV